MKFKLLILIFLAILINPTFSQQVEITHLHEFENLSINKMLLNDDGNLVVAGSKWDGATNFYFGIYDTNNFQVIADTMHSRWDCMNPENIFYDLVAHPDSGYLVCGRISQCGGNRPVIYWFNNQAQLIGEFNGDYWGNSNDGNRPIFEDLIVRSDNHILATYRYTEMAPGTNSIISTILMEFDKNLVLISSDTLWRSHTLRMQYVKNIEKIVLFGETYTSNTPYNPHPYYITIDAYTFQTETELPFLNETGYSDGVAFKNNLLCFSFHTLDLYNEQKFFSFDISLSNFMDSLILQQDSLKFTSNYSHPNLYWENDKIISFGTIYDHHKPISDFSKNHIRILSSDLEIIKDTTIEDINESAIISTLKTENSFHFQYKKTFATQASVSVLKKADLFLVSSVQKSNQEYQFKTYPNPVKETLHYDIPINHPSKTLEFQIFSTSGILLNSGILEQSLNVSKLPSGLYILTISNNNQILFTNKISKL